MGMGNSKKWKGGFILRGDFLNFLWIRIKPWLPSCDDVAGGADYGLLPSLIDRPWPGTTCLVTVMADRALGTCVGTGTTSVAGWACMNPYEEIDFQI